MAKDILQNNRVFQHTDLNSNTQIQLELEKSVTFYSHNPDKIENRLNELNSEWDIERMLEANASGIALFGLLLGIFGKRGWIILPIVVLGFLMQHAIQGWCPPISIFRRMGMRTSEEINRERNALRAIRGDYEPLAKINSEKGMDKVRLVLKNLAS